MAIKEIPLNKLRIGMYLVGIDVAWVKSPFYKHRFMITKEGEISALKKIGVQLVKVDTDKCLKAEEAEEKIQAIQKAAPAPPKPTTLKNEIDSSKKLEGEAKKQLLKAFSASAEGDTISSEDLTNLVDKSSESLLRNSHALLSVFHSQVQDADVANHAFKCMALTLMMGQRLDMDEQGLRNLGTAALLMDIGWSRLPSKLFKYEYGYSEEEFSIIQQHVDFGIDILEKNGFDNDIINMMSMQHERYDGSGYPYGHAGKDIPLTSQILSIVDHYDSKINGYYDSPKVIPATALKEIYRHAQKGKHHIALVELLIRITGIYPVSSAVLLNTGEKGIITKVNWKAPMMPAVKVLYSRRGEVLHRPVDLDLNKQFDEDNLRKIKHILDPNSEEHDPAGILSFYI